MTTFYQFMTALSELEITGVKKAYALNDAPSQLNALPAQWAQVPGTGDKIGVSEPACVGGSQTHEWTGSLVVVLGPTAQGLPGENHVAAIQMVDTVAGALDGAALSFGIGPITYNVVIRPNLMVGGIEYWAITADVTALGS